MFGLHPELAPLLPLWNAGTLAAVHATGLPAPNRSHFAAMEAVEDADPGSAARSGWLNRLIGTGAGQLAAAGLQPRRRRRRRPRSTGPSRRCPPARRRRPASPARTSDDHGRRRRARCSTLWDARPLAAGARRCASTYAAVDEFGPAEGAADHSASYPDTDLGKALAEVARAIRGNVGVEVITVDQGDWDMHSGMGTVDRGLDEPTTPATCAGAIAAFFGDLGDQADEGHAGDDQRVRPPGRRERQPGPRPRLRQRHVRRRRRRQGRPATTARWPGLHRTPTTPTCWSPPTTAACSPRSCRSGSARRPPRSSRGFSPETVGVMTSL